MLTFHWAVGINLISSSKDYSKIISLIHFNIKILCSISQIPSDIVEASSKEVHLLEVRETIFVDRGNSV